MSLDDVIASPSRQRIKAFYDKLHYATRATKSPRFKLVNPQKIQELFANRPCYEYVKKVAVERWYKTLKDQLELVTQLNHCEEYDLSQVEKLSHDVFNWSYEDFLRRRNLDNCIWVEVVIRNSSEKCLEKQKVKVDLKELKKFVDMLYRTIVSTAIYGGKVDLEKTIWKPLRDAERYSYLPQIIENERTQLKTELQELQNRYINENVTDRLEEQHKQVMVLEDVVMNSDVWDPIAVRLELNWYRSIVNQNQYQTDIVHFHYVRDIEYLKNKIVTEKGCSGSVLGTYYSDVEQYKRRISDLQERYDLEFDQWDNNNNYIQGQIDKLRDTKKFLRQEIRRFHFEIERRLAKEERWRVEIEEKRLAKEAADLALLEAAKLKKQKTKDNKGDGDKGNPNKKKK